MVVTCVQQQQGTPIRKDVFSRSATSFQTVGRLNSPSSSVNVLEKSSSSASSKEDSDSDCTCDIDSSSNLEDSGLFSCEGEVDSIIAPPSPFVTRSYVKNLQRNKDDFSQNNEKDLNSKNLRQNRNKDDFSQNNEKDLNSKNLRQNRIKDFSQNNEKDLNSSFCNNISSSNAAPIVRIQSSRDSQQIADRSSVLPSKSSTENHATILPVTKVAGPTKLSSENTVNPVHSTTIYVNGASTATSTGTRDNNKSVTKTDLRNTTDVQSVCKKPELQGGSSKAAEKRISEPEDTILSYPSVAPPICLNCVRKEMYYFDPNCQSCWILLQKDDSTPSHIFAILRLWLPQIQKCIARLIQIALDLGCGVLDRDAVTDMTLLHYAVKSGSGGIGDPNAALQVVANLLEMGADLRQRCKWTSMTALHYAAYFDVPNVLDVILQYDDGVPIDDPCLEYSNGSPLHIAASNLSEGSIRILLRHGASRICEDNRGRVALDCIPSYERYGLVPDLQELVGRLKSLLRVDGIQEDVNLATSPEGSVKGMWGKAILRAIGLKIGDRVLITGEKTGILRFAGQTEFATGLWAGVELELPHGRHNGVVKGVVYFRCAKNYGLFVPLNRLMKIPDVVGQSGRERRRSRQPRVTTRRDTSSRGRSLSLPPGKVNHGRVDISKIESKVAQDIKNSERKLEPNDLVTVDMGADRLGTSYVNGVVRFTGPVHFACGYWIGVELDEAQGSHDGSVCGTRYFCCNHQCGIFAAPSRVTKLPITNNDNIRSHFKTRLQKSSSNSMKLSDSFSTSSSTSSLLQGEESFVPLALPGSSMLNTSFYPTHTSMSNLNKCFTARYIRSRQRQIEIEREKEEKLKEPQWEELPPDLHDPVADRKHIKENPHWLQVGHTVFYKNKTGIVKYIGNVHFSEGIWLGLELRERRGKHNGFVRGEKYFCCRFGHGVMVLPSHVTVHGLNGNLLVKREEYENEDPFEDLTTL